MIHHSNVKCDECGERHSPGHPIECRDVLQAQRDDARDELAACREERDRTIQTGEKLTDEFMSVVAERANFRCLIRKLLCVLAGPGVMDMDEWKALKRAVETEARAAIGPEEKT